MKLAQKEGLITLRILDSPYDRINWRRARVILELHRYIVLQRVGSGEVEVTATLRLFFVISCYTLD